MTTIRVLIARLSGVFSRRDAELHDEINTHLDLLTQDNLRLGMTPEQARGAAVRAFGGVSRTKETYRRQRGLPLLDAVARDLVYALRQLHRSPLFALVAIGSVALGIGATTTAYAFLNALVLNPMPYPGADRMFTLSLLTEKGEGRGGVALNGREFAELQKMDVLDGAIATAAWDMTMTGARPVHVRAAQFSGNVFEYYGVRLALGRPFTMAEASLTTEPEPVVVLSHRFWQRHFAGDPGVIGRVIRLDGQAFTVIGVAPRQFRHMSADLYMPLRRPMDANNHYGIEARVRRDLPYQEEGRLLKAPAVEAALQPFVDRLGLETPGRFPQDARRVILLPSVSARAARFRTTFTMLLAATATLLALGCANVSILLLARIASRGHEMALRAALGASRRRLVGQLLVESLLLAALGGFLGAALAWGGVPAILEWLPRDYLPNDVAIEVRPRLVAFTTATAMLTGVLFGVLPAVQLSRADLRQSVQPALLAATSTTTKRAHHVLIAMQVALSVLLLAGAGTALTAFRALTGTALNFESDRVLVATLPLLEGSYTDWTARTSFFDRVRQGVSSLPGVEHAALSFGFVCCAGPAVPPLQPMLLAASKDVQPATVHRVTSNLFSMLGIGLRAGRTWTEAEHARAAPVAVVAQLAADQLWPGQNPMGQRVRLPQLKARQSWETSAPGSDGWLEVIGVVADIPTTGLRQPSRWPVVYVPFTLNMGDIAKLVVRTRGEPLSLVAPIQRDIQAIDANQPLSDTETAREILRTTGWGRDEITASVLLVVAAVGLVLASVGLYSVVSYITSQGVREFGIRRALGARTSGLVWRVIRSTLTVVAIGAAIGVVLSATFDRFASELTQLQTRDPLILAAAVCLLVASALLATIIPAWRASRVDPMIALRCD